MAFSSRKSHLAGSTQGHGCSGFALGHPTGEKQYESAIKEAIAGGVNVVLDYLWGKSARTVIAAIVRNVEDATPVRFAHVGGASGEDSIDLPGAALPSHPPRVLE